MKDHELIAVERGLATPPGRFGGCPLLIMSTWPEVGENGTPVIVAACDWRRSSAPEELLASTERDDLARLREPGRRLEWLRGRLTAKAAVRHLVGTDVQITAGGDGAPQVRDARGVIRDMTLSLSHTGSVVLCAVQCGPARLGVDVERIDAGNDVFLRRVMVAGDETAIPQGRPGWQSTALVACKEAAVKAYGRPTVRLRDYRLMRDPGGDLRIAVHGTGLPPLRVWCAAARGLLTALCAPLDCRPARHHLTPALVLRTLAAPPAVRPGCPKGSRSPDASAATLVSPAPGDGTSLLSPPATGTGSTP